MLIFGYKGYLLAQDNHRNYTIYDPEGKRLIHVNYDGFFFTKDEAQNCIKSFLALSNKEIEK